MKKGFVHTRFAKVISIILILIIPCVIFIGPKKLYCNPNDFAEEDCDHDGIENLYDDDFDNDGIKDKYEYYIAKVCSPILRFSSDETCDIYTEVIAPYQVSPLKDEKGNNYILLSYVFLYPEDFGADIETNWWQDFLLWCISSYICAALGSSAGGILDVGLQEICADVGLRIGMGTGTISTLIFKWILTSGGLNRHCGDSERFSLLFQVLNSLDSGSPKIKLIKIIWKRHYDEPYYDVPCSVEYFPFPCYDEDKQLSRAKFSVPWNDYAPDDKGMHPILYVSKDKHAMYPDLDLCEEYVAKWKEINFGIFKIDPVEELLKIKYEDCGWFKMVSTPTPFYLNVGEYNAPNHNALDGTIYEGVDPWDQGKEFTGRTDKQTGCDGDAGELGEKWFYPQTIQSDFSEAPLFGDYGSINIEF